MLYYQLSKIVEKMSYTVKSSEHQRSRASDTETKALLYMMNCHYNSKEIYYFVIDFFNDLTGMDQWSSKMWDLQSKGSSTTSPKQIGRDLVTLYKNYCSQLIFDGFVLFLEKFPSTMLRDNKKSVFNLNNINRDGINKIQKGLIEECKKKEYIHSDWIKKDKINDFLGRVLFVVSSRSKSEYIKKIVENHPNIIPSDEELDAIFNELRDIQSAKKNTRSIEGIQINSQDQCLEFGRHLTAGEIKLLVLGRIINKNPFEKGIPNSFLYILNNHPWERQKSLIEECRIALSRALFNVNLSDNFWKLFSDIYEIITKAEEAVDIDFVFLNLDINVKKGCPDFDTLSLKFFIASVMEEVGNDNKKSCNR